MFAASSLRGLGSSGMHSVRMSDASPFSTVAYTVLRLLFEGTRPSASSASAAIHRSPRRRFVSLERTSPYPDSRPASLVEFRRGREAEVRAFQFIHGRLSVPTPLSVEPWN